MQSTSAVPYASSGTSSLPTPSNDDIAALLEGCRSPDQRPNKQLMASLQTFLMRSTVDVSFDSWHWFCSTSQPDPPPATLEVPRSDLIRETATYLITLHAYNATPAVERYKTALASLLKRCTGCAEGYETVKLRLEEAYLSQYNARKISEFFSVISRWDISLILEAASSSSSSTSATTTSGSISSSPRLSRLPPSLVLLILSNPVVASHPSIQSLLESAAASSATAGPHDVQVHLDRRYPFFGEGLLSLLLARPPPIPLHSSSTGFDPPHPVEPSPDSSTIRRLALANLLPLSHTVTLDRLSYSLPAVERLLFLVSYPATTPEEVKSAWEVLELLLRSLSEESIRDGLIGGMRGEQGVEAGVRLYRTDRWLDENSGERSRWRRMAQFVCSQMGERVSYFPVILSCFHMLLQSSSDRLWSTSTLPMSSTPPNPLLVFDTLRANPSYTSSLEDGSDEHVALDWVAPFVQSLSSRSSTGPVGIAQDSGKDKERHGLAGGEEYFGEGLKKVANFLAEGLQHSRFSVVVRAKAMAVFLDILEQNASPSVPIPSPSSSHVVAYRQTLSIYSSAITSLAFALKPYQEPTDWASARAIALRVISSAFETDATTLRSGVTRLGQTLTKKGVKGELIESTPWDGTGPEFDINESLWRKTYDSIGHSDVDAMGLLVKAVAKFAHVDVLDTASDAWSFESLHQDHRRASRKAVEQLNLSLGAAREPFATSLERFANIAERHSLLAFWSLPGVTVASLSLLLSPIEDIHQSSQFLIQQTFNDAEDRADCFRALLQNMPEQAMEGLIAFLRTFLETASSLPEACAMAKWMVRCLTDVIDVLCQQPRGLLRHEAFVSTPGIRRLVPKLWQLMTQSISLVFDRSPKWAPFYLNEVMVDWMRDALIFARLMVDQTRTFETAASGGSAAGGLGYTSSSSSMVEPSPAKLSTVGRGMIDSLQTVLRDLMAWLRLTDVETLHQSFELIKTILERFHRSKISPFDESIAKLQGFTQRAKGHKSKLTDSQLAEISDLLAWWEDDEVEIVEMNQRSKEPSMVRPGSLTSKSRLLTDASGRPATSAATSASTSRASSVTTSETAKKKNDPDAWAKLMGTSRVVKKLEAHKATISASKDRRTHNVSSPAPSSDVPEHDEYDDEFPDLDLSNIDLDNVGRTTSIRTSGASTGRIDPFASSISKFASSSASSGSLYGRIRPPPPNIRPPPSKSTIQTLATSARAPKPAKSSSSSKSGLLGQLRTQHKAETRALPGIGKSTGPPPVPRAGLKSGFNLSLSNPLSGLAPEDASRRNRRTDTQDSASSASESSDDDDEEGERTGLAALSNFGKKKTSIAPPRQAVVQRTVKLMPDVVAIKTPQQIRAEQREAAHRTRLRLKPDLDVLHRQILKWSPEATGDYPPGVTEEQLHKIPPTFASAEQYVATLEPLLMLECWSQVQKAKEDSQNEERIVCDVAGRSITDDWVDIEVSVPSGEMRREYFLSDTDVVQLRLNGVHGAYSNFAKVLSYKKTFNDTQITFRFHNSQNLMPFVARSKWQFQKILNLSTMHREFAGLKGMPYYDQMLKAVLEAHSSPLVEPPSSQVTRAMDAYSVNEPQAKAILGAMNPNTSGFVLIQGPPGTGKTSTICGLVGKFISDRPAPETKIQAGRGASRAEDIQPKLKILICAPSNAAIDEVTKRLKDGIRSSSGKTVNPKIVRLGNDSSINIAVKDVSLDELIDQKLRGANAAGGANGDGAAEMARIRAELDVVRAKMESKSDELRKVTGVDPVRTRELDDEFRKIKAKRYALTQELNKCKDSQKDANRSLDAARRKARQDVINEADVICSTLSGAGHDILSSFNFETVIIDEAAQAVELSALIPLKYQCRRCIMVGDPLQLPPTVMSKVAEKFNYSESMFVRIQRRAPKNVHLLSIQYRMHPEISVLPSRVFYDGRLQDGPNMATKTAAAWHSSPAFAPYRFFNVQSREVSAGSHSLKNPVEADVVLRLYQSLKAQFPGVDFDYRVGIVTMYKEQRFELVRKFRQYYGQSITSTVDFNTVDGFQGQEKDIIILSCVRASAPDSTSGIGFLKDARRMNVALTRARSSLYIIGHAPTLRNGGHQWQGIVEDADRRGALIEYQPNIFTQLSVSKRNGSSASKSTGVARPPSPNGPPPPLPAPSSILPSNDVNTSKKTKKDNKERKRPASPVPDDLVPLKRSKSTSEKASTKGRTTTDDREGKNNKKEEEDDVERSSSTSKRKRDVEEGATKSSTSSKDKPKVDRTQAKAKTAEKGGHDSKSGPPPAVFISKKPPPPTLAGNSTTAGSKPLPPKKAAPNLFVPTKKPKRDPTSTSSSSSKGGGLSARARIEAGLPLKGPPR